MGQLIRVDFTRRRRLDLPSEDFDDPVSIAKRIKRAIKKADLRPRLMVSVRTRRTQSIIEPHRIEVTVKGFADRVYSADWLDWDVNPETKHIPRPPEAELPRYTPALASLMRTIRSIIGLHPGNYEAQLDVSPHLYTDELATRQRAWLRAGVTS